jgi:uracil-DNA glycosylase
MTTTLSKPKICPTWLPHLEHLFHDPIMLQLKEFLQKEKEQGHIIYPAMSKIFAAFSLTPFESVKVVIAGQDPYHGPNQAEGLCFSVPEGIKKPPSLVNIFKELHDDLKIDPPAHGSLKSWAGQGVLLLNTSLTVRANEAASHSGQGWEFFTDRVIQTLSEHKDFIIFVLWGAHAQSKIKLIDTTRHAIIASAHPSPLSAYRGFFGSKPFSKINDLLKEHGLDVIDWTLK